MPESSRREFLRSLAAAGAASATPLAAARPLARPLATDGPTRKPTAQSVIHIFLQGGMSHLDTWDPKPMAPVEYRGELRAIPGVDGDEISELLRLTAKVAGELAILRAVTHTEAAHERGTHTMLTGYQPSPAIVYPSCGAVVAHELGVRNDLPPYVCIPSAREGFLGTGYLSNAYAPFTPGSDPGGRGRFRVRDLNAPKGVDAARRERRRALLGDLDSAAEGEGFPATDDAVTATHAFYEQAFALLESKTARAAFDLDQENKKLRDRYGRSGIGPRLLLARRLAAAGSRWITVVDGGWDHHRNIFPSLRARMRSFDLGFSALIGDLKRQGMLDSTMVIVSSEFGRTPKLNNDAGRDHWPRVFSSVMAGGGIRGGVAHGQSDELGSSPAEDAVRPADMAATAFQALGIDPAKRLVSPGGRPIDIVRGGTVLREILG